MESGYKTCLPEWTWTDNRDNLPAALNWNGNDDQIQVGSQVMVDMSSERQDDENNRFEDDWNGTEGEMGFVAGYLHENGNLRVVVFLDNPPEELKAANGSYPIYKLGSQVSSIGYVGPDEMVKPALQEHSIDYLYPYARVAVLAERAATAAHEAVRAITLVDNYTSSKAERNLREAARAADGDELSEDSDLPF